LLPQQLSPPCGCHYSSELKQEDGFISKVVQKQDENVTLEFTTQVSVEIPGLQA
jgi:hypothetical protein